MSHTWLRAAGWLVLGLLLLTVAPSPAAGAPESLQTARIDRALPSGTCNGGSPNCHRGSPTLADVDGDGRLDIIVATMNGHIVAIKDNGTPQGQVLFDTDIGPFVGEGPNGAWISSSPAAADIDNNDGGRVEIVVGFGYELGSATRGGVIVLEHTGAVKAGWPKMSIGTHGNGNPHSVISSPALGDLDNDGDMEIVYGGFDKRIYARHHNGAMLPGFTPDSHLAERFPTWDVLNGRLADSIWGSPALADMNNDGFLDIVITTDEGNFDDRYGGDSGGWTCPYALPPGTAPGYCGGAIYAVDRFGSILPGYPRYVLEHLQSSPAIVDVDGDQLPEVFTGTGAYYWLFSPGQPTFGFKLWGFDSVGNAPAGWAGGKSTSHVTPAAPSIGDIAGDSAPEIVIGDLGGRLYAYNLDGTMVPGFPMTARTIDGSFAGWDVGKTFVLADYDGDGKMEIFSNLHNSVVIVDGNGQQLTTVNFGSDGKPGYTSNGWLMNSPAVGDIDNDGQLELIATDSKLRVWDLDDSSDAVHWGEFGRDSTGQSYFEAPGTLAPLQEDVVIFQDQASSTSTVGGLMIRNVGETELNWEIDVEALPNDVQFSQLSGQLDGGEQFVVSVIVNNGSGYGLGWHELGDALISGTNAAEEPAGDGDVPVRLFVGTIYSSFLPATNSD